MPNTIFVELHVHKATISVAIAGDRHGIALRVLAPQRGLRWLCCPLAQVADVRVLGTPSDS